MFGLHIGEVQWNDLISSYTMHLFFQNLNLLLFFNREYFLN